MDDDVEMARENRVREGDDLEADVDDVDDEGVRAVREKHQRLFTREMSEVDNPARTVFKKLGFTSLSVTGELAAEFGMGEGLTSRRDELKKYLENRIYERMMQLYRKGEDPLGIVLGFGFSAEHGKEWLTKEGFEVNLWEGDMIGICSALKAFLKLRIQRSLSLDRRRRIHRRLRREKARRPLSDMNSSASRNDWKILKTGTNREISDHFQKSFSRLVSRLPEGKLATEEFAWLADPSSFSIEVSREPNDQLRIHVTCKCGTKLRLFVTHTTANIGALRRHLFGAGKEAATCKLMKVVE
ncbi:hypothetical protein NDN08_008358 [Rhodosorus marinus]|uniref:Uncharacterized protein n=1 Tax=Rhodosorus marinus TaxID=101924 RepID=A0AAV8V3I4_9RHOD|nr:hypothetical protein NDN08_008358 [Rhodosorus marinus]